jgi:hypothetical protein
MMIAMMMWISSGFRFPGIQLEQRGGRGRRSWWRGGGRGEGGWGGQGVRIMRGHYKLKTLEDGEGGCNHATATSVRCDIYELII